MLESYATVQYYLNDYGGTSIAADAVERALFTASRHIDTLTFNRIVAKTFDGLTPFQQEVVQRITCALAEWETNNEDILQSAVSGYSINGVSLSFGAGGTLYSQGGVILPKTLYGELAQTGLTYRGF